MSGLNVDRMRRHVARTTPDRIEVPVIALDVEATQEALNHWIGLMRQKHGERFSWTAWVSPDRTRVVAKVESREAGA